MTEPSKWALKEANRLWLKMVGRHYEDQPTIANALDAARRQGLEEAAALVEDFGNLEIRDVICDLINREPTP